MKILGIIPARYASTRFPAKPLIDIAGKTMIQRVYEQAKQCTLFSKIIVATDDDKIYDHVLQIGGDVMMTSTTHQNGTERCAEVIENLSDQFEIIINIQGDEPFVDPALFTMLIQAFKDPQIQIATLIKPIIDKAYIDNPNIIKVVKSVTNKALYFSRAAIPFQRNEAAKIQFYKHIGLYAYRKEVLLEIVKLGAGVYEQIEMLEQLRWLENNHPIHLIETDLEADSIDVPADLDRLLKKYF
jgi:3-deoxy-manno-octulosonate cytidylyltransferase (CMP-KDO synthetase)